MFSYGFVLFYDFADLGPPMVWITSKSYLRDGKKEIPSAISVHLLDGRYDSKGEEKDGTYNVSLAHENEEFDFIFISVASGNLNNALATIHKRNIERIRFIGIQTAVIPIIDNKTLNFNLIRINRERHDT